MIIRSDTRPHGERNMPVISQGQGHTFMINHRGKTTNMARDKYSSRISLFTTGYEAQTNLCSFDEH